MHHSSVLFAPLLLDFFFFFFFLLPSSSSQRSRYEDCAPFECGDSTRISYPFREKTQPIYCGHPGFDLTCDQVSNATVLQLQSDSYKVLQIRYDLHRLLIVNKQFLSNACPQPEKNVTLDPSTPFSFRPSDQNLSLYSNCSKPIENSSFSLLPCITQNGRFAYFTAIYGDDKILSNCGYPVVVLIRDKSVWGLHSMNLNFSEALRDGFWLVWKADECAACEVSGGRCGNNGTTSLPGFICFCTDQEFPANCAELTGRKSQTRLKVIIGSTASTGTIILAVLLLFVSRLISQSTNSMLFWKKPKSRIDFEKVLKNYGNQMPKRYSYSDIRRMTNFQKGKLGEGGYGTVFKGQLLDGSPVAVKILSDAKGKGDDFINEVATIGTTAHVNIVRLMGFCSEGSRRALIYEFMPNGSLEKFIFAENPKEGLLGYEKLFKIALGIARGLEYLHRGCNTRILHFDIKPHNILLDQDFCPKISDFGLAKLCPNKKSIVSMTGARGTVGYIAPELVSRTFGMVSNKSDVYTYGMLLLEMVGGRKNVDAQVDNASEIYFPDWIYKQLEGDSDLQLGEIKTQIEDEIARKMIIVGLWCIQTKPANRPTMSKVIEMLEGNIQGLQIPPKPYFATPSESENTISTNC